jgi:hypothetical protein
MITKNILVILELSKDLSARLKWLPTSRALRRPGFAIPSARYAKLPKFIMLNLRLKLLRSGPHVADDDTCTNAQN